MGKRGTEVKREKPALEGKAAEEFIERWNAITTAIKNAAGKRKEKKEANYDAIE